MINTHSSRRNFLGSIALLSAGTAFGTVRCFVPGTVATDLQGLWKQFCRQNGGQRHDDKVSIADTLPGCKGHSYETGEMVAFYRHDLLAQPTWIYWSEEKKQAADIVITLYKNDTAKTKLHRLNRFEWEALLSLPADTEEHDVVALMKEAGKPRSAREQGKATVPLKVNVLKGRNVSIAARLQQKDIIINKQFLYSI
jgi:hypothetical protein